MIKEYELYLAGSNAGVIAGIKTEGGLMQSSLAGRLVWQSMRVWTAKWE